MKKKITVSILGTLPPIRALSSYCFELTCSVANICRVEFISFSKIYPAFLYPGGVPDDDHTYPEITNPDISVRRRLAWYNPLSWLTEGLTATGDLLHAQWWSMPLFPIYLVICICFKIRKKPVVFTVHNVFSHERSWIYEKLSGLLFKTGDHFIVHSDLNKRQLMEFYKISKTRISVIPHGSLDFHIRPQADRKALRHAFGYASEQKVVLIFGAIRPYKGIDTAIRAFAQIIQKSPNARLLIAGSVWGDWNPYARLIRELYLEPFVTTHLDYIPSGDVHKYFEIADLCVFPYLHFDSQSGAGAVALSFHKPMIVSDVGGLPDLVKDRRFIVPPGDPSALADAIRLCLENPEILSEMAEDAKTISAKFAWPAIAENTAMICRHVLKK
jgi:glycosyltransferase involved in cell wall biosynthesis